MNKLFLEKLMNYIDNKQKKLEEMNKITPIWEYMKEEQKIEIITRETEVSTLKWIKDIYIESIENED